MADGPLIELQMMEQPPLRTSLPKASISADTDAYVELISALRELLQRVARISPHVAMSVQAAQEVRALCDRLADYEVEFERRIYGLRDDVPGRAQFLVPCYDRSALNASAGAVTVTFGDIYSGSLGAVHGGAIALLFDDVLGFVANLGRDLARTAYLHVDYRAITRMNTGLNLEYRVNRQAGRKLFVRATLRDGDTITAEAEGLFVTVCDQPSL